MQKFCNFVILYVLIYNCCPYIKSLVGFTGNYWSFSLIMTIIGTIAPGLIKNDVLNINANFFKCITLPDYQEQLGFLNGVEDLVTFALKHLTDNGNKRVVLFIDNLDRCSDENIIDVLDAISKFLNICPQCSQLKNKKWQFWKKKTGQNDFMDIISVLAIDYDIINKAVDNKRTKSSKKDTDDYLDKIINFPFFIPKAGNCKQLLETYLPLNNIQPKTNNDTNNTTQEEMPENNRPYANFANENEQYDNTIHYKEKKILSEEERNHLIEAIQHIHLNTGYSPRKIEKIVNLYIVFKSIYQEDLTVDYKRLIWWFGFTIEHADIINKNNIDSIKQYLKENQNLRYHNPDPFNSENEPFEDTEEFEKLFAASAIFLKPFKEQTQKQ